MASNSVEMGVAAAIGAAVGAMAVKYAETKREEAAKKVMRDNWNTKTAESISAKQRRALTARNNGA